MLALAKNNVRMEGGVLQLSGGESMILCTIINPFSKKIQGCSSVFGILSKNKCPDRIVILVMNSAMVLIKVVIIINQTPSKSINRQKIVIKN